MDEIKLNRDEILGLKFENPKGAHGKKGSGKAHAEIRKMIDSSLNYDNFVRRLHTWADYRLPDIIINGRTYPGSARLPGNLRNQEAIDFIDRLYDEQNKANSCGGK